MTDTFNTAQEFEASWWGNCANTLEEEIKQLVYASRMGLTFNNQFWLTGLGGRIVDIGGGPCSLLLKTGLGGTVVDPCPYPAWVANRYSAAGIRVVDCRGEDFLETGYGEAWIYNVLQHVDDPELLIARARAAAPVLRIFEWIDIPAYPGHPQCLTRAALEGYCGNTGVVETLNDGHCCGTAWYGFFDYHKPVRQGVF